MENFDIIDANKLYVDLLVQCVGPTWDFCTGPQFVPGQPWARLGSLFQQASLNDSTGWV